MEVIKENKTKRLNIRITPKQHSWLFRFAKRKKTSVSALFAKFLLFLKRADADGEIEL
jgi:hypothetical protein